MSRTALAFMSYVNLDDQHEQGRLTRFRECLSGEVRMQTGEPFDIFQDRKDIAWGQQWQERINHSLDAVTFLIPIITPGFFKSTACREELKYFLKREEELGRGDLILPVYYVRCPVLEDKAKREHDKLAQVIAARQYVDWTKLRLKPLSAVPVRKALAKMAQQIIEALEGSQAGILPTQSEKDGKEQRELTAELLRQLAEIKPYLSVLPEKAQNNLLNAIEEAEQEASQYNEERIREKLKSIQDALKAMSNNVTSVAVGELLGKALLFTTRVL